MNLEETISNIAESWIDGGYSSNDFLNESSSIYWKIVNLESKREELLADDPEKEDE